MTEPLWHKLELFKGTSKKTFYASDLKTLNEKMKELAFKGEFERARMDLIAEKKMLFELEQVWKDWEPKKMIIQSEIVGRCKKCGMFIEKGDWINIAPSGAILECMFDNQEIRAFVRDKEKEEFIKQCGEDFVELIRPEGSK